MATKKMLITPKPSQPASSLADPDAWVGGQSAPANGEPMKRFTFDVPASLHRRVKAACAAKGQEMAAEMRRILEEHFPE